MRRSIERRIETLEHRAEAAKPLAVHRIVFADDPEPLDLPPGSTVHRIVFVKSEGLD
jgi:hypothetical protein